MRKIVFGVMLIMVVCSISAQVSFIPEAGMSAVYNTNGTGLADWKPALKLGVGVEYQFKGDLFALQSGLYYTRRGDYVEGWPTHQKGDEFMRVESGKVSYNFLQIPLQAKFSWKLSDDIRMNVAAGPYLAIKLSQNSEWSSLGYGFKPDEHGGHYTGWGYGSNYYGYGGGYGSEGYSGEYGGYGYGYDYLYGGYYRGWPDRKTLDWGLTTSLGLEIKNWVINLGYDLALGKRYSWDDIEARHHTVSLSVGYKFTIK